MEAFFDFFDDRGLESAQDIVLTDRMDGELAEFLLLLTKVVDGVTEYVEPGRGNVSDERGDGSGVLQDVVLMGDFRRFPFADDIVFGEE